MLVIVYLAAIVAANLSIAAFGPAVAPLNAFLLIGLDLSARDRLHEQWRGNVLPRMAALIAAGSLLSWLLNRNAGPIALASFLAFGGAAIADTLVYAALGRSGWLTRANSSNAVSAVVDSLIFVPTAFGALLWPVIVMQVVAKIIGGFCWSWALRPRRMEAL